MLEVGYPCLNLDGTPRLRYTPHFPYEKQWLFLGLTGREALYGGAAGGGKSDALLMCALQFVDVPQYSAMIMRRSLSDLELSGALIPRSHKWLDDTDAKWNGSTYCWNFPSGARLQFGFITGKPREDENAMARYKSSEFQCIIFDEATEFSEIELSYMQSRLRKNNEGEKNEDGLSIADVPLRMRYASNPGGPSHTFFKENFIEGDRGVFIQSFYSDNPYLDHAEYEKSLSQLSPVQKRWLMFGDWESVEVPGAIFSRDYLNYHSLPEYDVKICSVDPAGSNTESSDLTGVIITGLHQGHGFAIEDYSGRYDILGIPEQVLSWAHQHGCNLIRVEDDYGKDNSYVLNELKRISDIPVEGVATQGKSKSERAKEIANLYRQGLIHHTKKLGYLEDQMFSWIPGVSSSSPDRIDAMVWGFWDLILSGATPYSLANMKPLAEPDYEKPVRGLAGLL